MTPYSRAKYRLANAEIQTPKKSSGRIVLSQAIQIVKKAFAQSALSNTMPKQKMAHTTWKSIRAELNCKLLSFRVHKKENSFKWESAFQELCSKVTYVGTWKLESLFLKVTKHNFCCVISGDQSVNFVSKIGVFDISIFALKILLTVFSDLPLKKYVNWKASKKVFWFV